MHLADLNFNFSFLIAYNIMVDTLEKENVCNSSLQMVLIRIVNNFEFLQFYVKLFHLYYSWYR